MAGQIQTQYPLSQERGQVGQLSRPLAPHDVDRVKIAAGGAGLKPGDAYKLSGEEAIKIVDLADSVNAYGILGFEVGTVNKDLAGGTQHTQGVEYAEGDHAKVYLSGYVYAIAGGAVVKGASIGFDPADGKWKALAGTKFVAAAASADGEIIEVVARVLN